MKNYWLGGEKYMQTNENKAEKTKLEWWHIFIVLGVTIGIGVILALISSSGISGEVSAPKPPSEPPTTLCPSKVRYVNYGKFRNGEKVIVKADPFFNAIIIRYDPCYDESPKVIYSVRPELEATILMDWGVEYYKEETHYRVVFWKVQFSPEYGSGIGWVEEDLIVKKQ